MRSALLPLALLAAACAPSIPLVPTGSGTVAADATGARLATVNPFEGTLSIVNVGAHAAVEVAVGEAPTRVVVVGDRAIATLRGDRALVEVDLGTGDVVREVPTGPEPYGIVASADGTRIYVSVSQADVIEERDADTLEVLRTFSVGTEPRWLALHPDGHLLVAGHARGAFLTAVDLTSGQVAPLELPRHTTTAFGRLVDGEVLLSARVTGDPAFRADGSELVVPAFYVDHRSGELGPAEQVSLPTPTVAYYRSEQGAVADRMGRFNSTLVHYDVDSRGRLERRASATSRVVDAAPGVESPVVRQTYITSVVQGPDNRGWLVAMEASDTVLYVDDRPKETGWKRRDRLGFPQASAVSVGRGPAGLAVLDTRTVFVHEALDRTVSDVDQPELRRSLKHEVGDEGTPTAHSSVVSRLSLAESVLDPDVELGRNLFYDATNPVMGASGVSCSTCHFEGRTDGLTWELFNGPRNTPSLAGPISEFGVVTWNNPVDTVAQEAQFTVEHRMGAEGLRDHHAQRIEAFLAQTPLPDLPDPQASAIARGKALFERSDVGCATCHTGEHLTDGQAYDLYGLEGVRTRSLRGVAASAPYLHDGRAPTLRDVLESARDGSMGNTGSLTQAELDDLEAYLRSL